jgi:hypothetical protein
MIKLFSTAELRAGARSLEFINYCRRLCVVFWSEQQTRARRFHTFDPYIQRLGSRLILTNWCDNAGVLIFTHHAAAHNQASKKPTHSIPFFIKLDWKVLSSRYNALRGTGGCVCLRCANSEG